MLLRKNFLTNLTQLYYLRKRKYKISLKNIEIEKGITISCGAAQTKFFILLSNVSLTMTLLSN